MYGFTIIHSQKINTEKLPETKKSFIFSLLDNSTLFFGYDYFEKFSNDKIFKESTKLILGIDGVILNSRQLKNSYAISDFFELISTLFLKKQLEFISLLKGEFCGFIFDKVNEKLYVFNNKTGTKQLFYTIFNNEFILSHSLKKIIGYKEANSSLNRLYKPALYDMLSFGTTIGKLTLIKDIFKLEAGKLLEINKLSLSEKTYHSYNTISKTITSKKDAINKINETFTNAVQLEYQKDIEYNYTHLALLSGGLDSRMNVLCAKSLGYKPKTVCFSIDNYLDEKISKKIAKDLELKHFFISLEEGLYMNNVSENTRINNGLSVFTSSAHYNFALKKLNFNNSGLIHTGQIGDGIFGGLLTKNNNYLSKIIKKDFLEKGSITKSFLKNYKNEEVFKLYQYVFNITHTGSFTTENYKTYLTSPFLDDDVLSVAISIDNKLKYNQNIYLDWIKDKHPIAAKYIWERTGFKPNSKWKTSLSKYTKKLKKEWYLLFNQEYKLSMAPEDFWLLNNNKISKFYSDFFDEYSNLLYKDKELLEDIKDYYSKGNSQKKAIVLTILQAIKMYNIKL